MAHSPAMPSPWLCRHFKDCRHRFRQGRRGQDHGRRQPGHCAFPHGPAGGLIDADIYGPTFPDDGSTQSPAMGADNRIQPNLTHGIKTISIGYISPGTSRW